MTEDTLEYIVGSLRRAHYLIIGICLLVFTVIASLWNEVEGDQEADSLRRLLSELDGSPEVVLERYHPEWNDYRSYDISELIGSEIGVAILYNSSIARYNTVESLQEVSFVSFDIHESSTIREISRAMEKDLSLRVRYASGVDKCETSDNVKISARIMRVVEGNVGSDTVYSRLSLGRRVGQVGAPPAPYGEVECTWTTVDTLLSVMKAGDFGESFPNLMESYADSSLTSAEIGTRFQRVEAISKSVEYGDFGIRIESIVLPIVLVFILINVYMLSMMYSIDQIEKMNWIGFMNNYWSYIFNVTTILILPIISICFSLMMINKVNFFQAMLICLPQASMGALIIFRSRTLGMQSPQSPTAAD